MQRKPQVPGNNDLGLYSLFRERNIRSMFFNSINLDTACNARLICKSIQKAIDSNDQESLLLLAKKKLPDFVVSANWVALEKLFRWNPDLIFKRFETCLLRSPVGINALEYACHVLDIRLLAVCKSALRPDQFAKYAFTLLKFDVDDSVPVISANGDYGMALTTAMVRFLDCGASPSALNDLRYFLEIMICELSNSRGLRPAKPFHQDVFSLTLFYWVYEFFIKASQAANKSRPWNWDGLISDENLDILWAKVHGFALKCLLPRHMLKQMLEHNTHIYEFS